MVRVLHLIERMGAGGAERHVLDLVAALNDGGDLGWILAEPGELASGDLLSVKPTARYFGWFRAIWAIREMNFQILHVHSVAPLPAARLYGALFRVPVVFTVHGWSAKKLRLAKWLLWLLRPSRTLVVSEALKERFELVNQSVDVVANGVIDRRPQSDAGRRASQRIVSVGRLAPPKNQQQLLRAFAELAPLAPDAVLVLVGEGADRSDLEKLAEELDLRGRIIFRGFIDPLPDLLAAHVFASSSSSEGLSLAHLEALMVGLPLVITDTSGASQVVNGENGTIVPVGDVPAMAEALLDAIAVDPRVPGEASRRLFLERFTHEAMLSEIRAVYAQQIS